MVQLSILVMTVTCCLVSMIRRVLLTLCVLIGVGNCCGPVNSGVILKAGLFIYLRGLTVY